VINGVDTRRPFVGRCVPLVKMLEQLSIDYFGSDDPPANLAHVFHWQLLCGLIGKTVRPDYLEMVEELYYSIDDPYLKHAIDEFHLWHLSINENGYYLANHDPHGR
jgi:hypothetical protein